jgi:hypothetical protein
MIVKASLLWLAYTHVDDFLLWEGASHVALPSLPDGYGSNSTVLNQG